MPAISSRGRGRRTINEINMVPFIDVMLVLLIIFMVTAPLITTGVVDLPSVGKSSKRRVSACPSWPTPAAPRRCAAGCWRTPR